MKSRFKYVLYLFLSVLLIGFCMIGTNNYIAAIAWAHFPTLILNNLFLMKEYSRINEKNNLINLIVPRIGYQKFMKEAYIENVINAILYSVYFHLSMYILYPFIPNGYELKIIIFIFINTLVYVFENLILILQYFNKKSIIYLVIVILINIVFHYFVIMKYLT